VGEHVSPGKPFEISKQEVWLAYQKVAANKGAAGVDEVGLAEFESDLKGNLEDSARICGQSRAR
jgi:RNA-directed DNA polymerase